MFNDFIKFSNLSNFSVQYLKSYVYVTAQIIFLIFFVCNELKVMVVKKS